MKGIKITQVEFNIGLNNNPYEEYEIRQILNRSGFRVFDTTPSFIARGEYLGDSEPTFVISVGTTLDEDAIHAEVSGLCKLMSQACIAILINNNKGSLVYHPHYDKKRLEFNREFFIDAYNKQFNKNHK